MEITRLCPAAMVAMSMLAPVAFAQEEAPGRAHEDEGYLLSAEPWHSDPEIWRSGFLSGLRGFEKFYNPVGNPIYFEPPTNTSELRFLYLRHSFPEGSVLQGGDLRVAAVQARLAITERWSLIATKDGYSWLDADALPEEEGWNALAAGVKWTFYADKEKDFLAAAGVRYMIDSGQSEILQGGSDELSPFVSAAKAWGPVQVIGSGTWRAPLDDDDGNHMLQWDLHVNYEVLSGLALLTEVRGFHYMSDGERTALPVGGLDYTNLGSNDVEGNDVVTAGIGARASLTPQLSIGAIWEVPLTDKSDDIFGDRVTVDLILRW